MFGIVLAAAWFGWRARRAGRSVLLWAPVGAAAFAAARTGVLWFSRTLHVQTDAQATLMMVLLNLAMYGVPFALGFLIDVPDAVAAPSGEGPTESGDR